MKFNLILVLVYAIAISNVMSQEDSSDSDTVETDDANDELLSNSTTVP